MIFRLGLFISVSISVLIHLVLLIYIPSLPRIEPERERLTYTEIELRELPAPLPEPKKVLSSSQNAPDASDQSSSLSTKEELLSPIQDGSTQAAAEEVTILPVPDKLLVINDFVKRAEEMSREKLPPQLDLLDKLQGREMRTQPEKFNFSTFVELPAPSLDIPKTHFKNREEEIFARLSRSLMTQFSPDRTGSNPFPSEALDTSIPSGLNRINIQEKNPPLKTDFKFTKEEPMISFNQAREWGKKGSGEEQQEGTTRFLEIKGPVAKRVIVYRPPIPKVSVEITTDIQLKFWVSPDGTVGRVIPLVKGDSRLEEEAIKYIKQWKFAPLASTEPQLDQWGTIPIKFLLG